MTTSMIFWASVVGVWGWLYAILATFGPHLFHSDYVTHGERGRVGYSGFKIGWSVAWRLPARAAALMAVLSALPILTALYAQSWLQMIALASLAGTIFLGWIIAPPGMILVFVQKSSPGGKDTVFELQRSRMTLGRSILTLSFSFILALALGFVLSQVLIRTFENVF